MQLLKKHFNSATHNNLSDIFQLFYPVKGAFLIFYGIYAAALTWGASTASFDRHACTYTVSTCHDSQMQSKSGAAEFPDSLYRIDGLEDFLVHFGQKIVYSSCKLNWVIDCVT